MADSSGRALLPLITHTRTKWFNFFIFFVVVVGGLVSGHVCPLDGSSVKGLGKSSFSPDFR